MEFAAGGIITSEMAVGVEDVFVGVRSAEDVGGGGGEGVEVSGNVAGGGGRGEGGGEEGSGGAPQHHRGRKRMRKPRSHRRIARFLRTGMDSNRVRARLYRRNCRLLGYRCQRGPRMALLGHRTLSNYICTLCYFFFF